MLFAAIYVPDFPVEAVVRAEPGLRELPVAVVEGNPPLVRVIAVNQQAGELGVEPGMTKVQAAEHLPEAQIRRRSAEQETAAHAAMLDCACGFSPRVEETATDTILLDLAGLERIFGPPAKIARDLARRCSELLLEANVAVASNPDAAMHAARGFPGVTVIPEGKEAERLGSLPIEVLLQPINGMCRDGSLTRPARLEDPLLHDPNRAAELLDTLERWGIRNFRALVALPEVAVTERLGQEGLTLQRLARGVTMRPLVVAEPPLDFEEMMELEHPIENLEPLAFLLNRMLEQLCARLSARALATHELRLTLQLDTSVRDDATECQMPNAEDQMGREDCRLSIDDCRMEAGPRPSAISDRDDRAIEPSGHRAIEKKRAPDHQIARSPDDSSIVIRHSALPSHSAISSQSSISNQQSSMFHRVLRLPVAMLDAKVFLKLLQMDLQSHPPGAPVVKIWLAAEPTLPRVAQNGLFLPLAPEPEKLELTLARIERVVGNGHPPSAMGQEDRVIESSGHRAIEKSRSPDHQIARSPDDSAFGNRHSAFSNQPSIENRQSLVGSPELLDTHRPGAFRMQKFAPPSPNYAGQSAPVEQQAPVTALRVFRPPLKVAINLRDGQPQSLACRQRPDLQGEVLWAAGPWCGSGEWWNEAPWAREEWDIAVAAPAGTVTCRLFRDVIKDEWFLEGIYD